MKKIKGLKGVIIALVLAILIVGYYYYISHKEAAPNEDIVELTEVQSVLQRNLFTNYPQTPKEVVKYFSDITQCFVNEDCSDEELKQLDDKMLLLLDDELISYKTKEDYLLDLKSYVATFKEANYKISSYTPSSSTDVEYFVEEGYECARLYCIYNIKSGKYLVKQQYVFILRKDDAGHYRVFGWRLVEDNE